MPLRAQKYGGTSVSDILINNQETMISCAILANYPELAVRTLHMVFGLDQE